MSIEPTNIDSSILSPRTLPALLQEQFVRKPESIAIGTSDLATTLTYRQLDRAVRLLAEQLAVYGLRPGHRVGLIGDNSMEFVVTLLATLSIGATVAPLNPKLSEEELGTRLGQLNVSALLMDRHVANGMTKNLLTGKRSAWTIASQGKEESFAVTVTGESGEAPEPGSVARKEVVIQSEDVALLMFTGGTTGPAKLVPLTHRNLVASAGHIASTYRLSAQDATLLVMPLFHGHGLIGGLLSTLASGGAAYVPSTGSFSAHLFWPDMIRVHGTWFTAVPTIHRILVSRAAHEYPGPAGVPLRFIRSCSAPLDDELALATAKTFHAPIIGAYGMTETSHQLASNPLPSNGPNKASSVGPAIGVEVRIVDRQGVDLEAGEVGEIFVRGEILTPGYLDNPQANASSFANGWFRTGDLGCKDDAGYIFVKGRLKEMINRGGEKISPNDIDATLLTHPDVLEAASFGEADPVYGENVQAAVILRLGTSATEDELKQYCTARLSAFEVPVRIYVVSALPRTAKGSVDRHALVTQFAPKQATA